MTHQFKHHPGDDPEFVRLLEEEQAIEESLYGPCQCAPCAAERARKLNKTSGGRDYRCHRST